MIRKVLTTNHVICIVAALFVILPQMALADTDITVLNESFEFINGGTDAITKTTASVDDWSGGAGLVEGTGTSGTPGEDPGFWVCGVVYSPGGTPLTQMTSHVIAAGDVYQLTYDGYFLWDPATASDPEAAGSLYYDDGGTVIIGTNSMVLLDAYVWYPDITVVTTAIPPLSPAIGKTLGIEFSVPTMTGSGWIGFDTVRLKTLSPAPTGPVPVDGAGGVVSSLSQLSWTNPPPDGAGSVTADVWLQEVTLGYDPNFSAGEKLTGTPTSNEFVSVSVTVDKIYEWQVIVYDTSAPGFTWVGPVWSFNTLNAAPVIDAGLNQSVWLSGGTASADLVGSASDDGLPSVPGSVTTTWSQVSGPALTGNTTPGLVTTTVSFDTAGTYVLELEGDDGLKTGTDTIELYVYEDAVDAALVAHWPFTTNMEDVSGDVSGNFHHGTPMGDATIDSGSLLLDGDDYVNCGGDTGDPNFPTWANPLDNTKFSVTCWIKSADMTNAWAAIISKGNFDGWKIQRNGSSDDVMFTVNNVSAAVAGDGDAIDGVQDDQWHHVAGVFMGDASYIYVDGILDATALWTSGAPVNGGLELWIGDHPDWPGNGFVGRMNDVRLYTAPLNGAKVVAEYAADGGTNSCGGIYGILDLNENCYNDIGDVAIFAAGYLECADVGNPACD